MPTDGPLAILATILRRRRKGIAQYPLSAASSLNLSGVSSATNHGPSPCGPLAILATILRRRRKESFQRYLFASSSLSLSAAPSLTIDLGRFQRGQRLTLVMDAAGIPDTPPIVTMIDGIGHAVGVYEIPLLVLPETFGREILLGAGLSLGTFLLRFNWSVGGSAKVITKQFELVPGGDSGGQVIAMFAYDRPEASYLVAQLSSGKLVQGRNPSL